MKNTKKNHTALVGGNQDTDKNPLVFKFSPIEVDFDPKELEVVIRGITPYPKGIYGFHHFIHQSREKLSIKSIFKGKKRIYKVYDDYNENIDDHDLTITTASAEYFKTKDVLSKSFFKTWEILVMFDLINNKPSMIASLLDDGNIYKAINYYREKFNKTSDSYLVMNDKNNVVKGSKNTTLLTDSTLLKKSDTKIDIIFCNYTSKSVLQEQEGFPTLVTQILYVLSNLKKGGNAVIKVYEMYTENTIKLLVILRRFFENMYVYKPYTSVHTSPEKYIILKNYIDKDNANIIKCLTTLRSDAISKKYVNDFFPKMVIPRIFINEVLTCNTELGNVCFKYINSIVGFINRENYRGDEYQERREIQIKSTNFWIEIFYSPLEEGRQIINDLMEITFLNNKKIVEKFNNVII